MHALFVFPYLKYFHHCELHVLYQSVASKSPEMCDYEENIRQRLGWESYEKCLSFCKEGKISLRQIQEIAIYLNQSIRGALQNQPTSVRESQRESFRFVMSEWYKHANKTAEALVQFNITRLIEVLRKAYVKQFPLAMELKESERNVTREKSFIHAGREDRPLSLDESIKDTGRMHRDWSSDGVLRQRTTSEMSTFGGSNIQSPNSDKSFSLIETHNNQSTTATSTSTLNRKLRKYTKPEKNIPSIGRKVPLNEVLISTMTYYMHDRDELDMLTVFATKIGQSAKMEELKAEGETRLDFMMKQLLYTWSPAVDVTEENLIRFLSGFPELSECEDALKDYVKRQSELKRTMSESDLTCMVGDENSIKAGESKSAPTPQTIKNSDMVLVSMNDLEFIVREAKKKVKDLSSFVNISETLGVPQIGTIIENEKKSRLSLDKYSRKKIMSYILTEWRLIKQNKGTTEELVTALCQCTLQATHGTFTKSIMKLLASTQNQQSSLSNGRAQLN